MRQDVSKFLRLMSVIAICLLGLGAQATVMGACSELEFGNPTMFPGGLQPHRLVTGDLNGDGNTDLAAANEGSGSIIIRFGDGSGGFPTSIQFSSASPTSIAIADFNNDGIPDLVTSNRTINAITVRLGLGGGAFRSPVQAAVGPSPSGVALADFNGDGYADIVTSNGGINTISILLGSGLGSFAAATSVVVPAASGLTGIVATDFDGDGHQDIATLNRGTLNISVMFGNGNGGFGSGRSYPAGGNQPSGIAARDLNNDGRPDLVTVNAASHNVVARFNDGFGAMTNAVSLATGVEPFAVAAADLDSDGHMDIVTTNRRSRSLSAFRGNGRGSFAARRDFPLSAGPRALAVADFNNNGMSDLATGIETGNIAVLLNTCSPNSAPTISSVSVMRQQDAGPSVSIIATIDDDIDDPAALSITVSDASPTATVNGVTVSNIAVSPDGIVTAAISAACAASDAMFLLTVTDSGGLSATATLGVDVTGETTAPVINNGRPLPNITVSLPAQSPNVSMPVNFDLPGAADNCTISPTVTSSHESGSVFGMGSTVVTVTATDELGNAGTATFRVNVMLNFGGLLSPIEPFPAINMANAGSSIPIKFSLSGYKGMNILAAGYPASSQVACSATAPGETLEETVSNGGLQYDASSDQYKYVWKTKKLWKQSCRILVLRLSDGSEHYARFNFR